MEHVDPLRGLRPVRAEDLEDVLTRRRVTSPSVLAYDTYRCDDELVIEFDIPGVDPSGVDLAVEDGEVVVTVRRELVRGPGVDIIDARRAHGVFTERLLLGSRWDPARLRARVENGVLSVRAPLAATSRRSVPVDVGSSHDGPRHETAGDAADDLREPVGASTAA